MKKIKCKCVNVQLGTYANSVALFPPADLGITRVPVTVDRCIAEEVQHLWSLGITTTGNCCGHNITTPYIGVTEECIPIMQQLGYTTAFNAVRPNDRDSFIPKCLMPKPDPFKDEYPPWQETVKTFIQDYPRASVLWAALFALAVGMLVFAALG